MNTLLQTLPTLAITSVFATGATAFNDDIEFEAPVELAAGGDTFVKILYPSPVLHDLNGDGQQQLIIGDLFGYLLAAERVSGDPEAGWGPANKINATDGKAIKFSNW